MTQKFGICYALTGGASDALDFIDGAGLADGYVVKTYEGGCEFTHILDADSAEAENSPWVISPDSNAGDKRWILQAVVVAGYDTIYIDAAAMISATTAGAEAMTNEYGTNDIDVDFYAFDGGATEERVIFKLCMPLDWDRGALKAKFFWTSATGSTAGDTVEWAIRAVAVGDDDAMDAAWGTPQVISDTLLADDGGDLQLSAATPAITVGGTPALQDMVFFEVSRNTDGTDDMAEDAWLAGVLIQYRKGRAIEAW